MTSAQTAHDALATFGVASIYLVGLGMVIGSLFTIFILLVLEAFRRWRDPHAK